MITKNQVKNLYYLDRDTDVEQLIEQKVRAKKIELLVIIGRMVDRLQAKDAGEYYTVEDVTKLKDGELEKMMRFYRGAVVPYFARQSLDHWDDGELDAGTIEAHHQIIKQSVGFMLYDHTGHITEETNSLATFARVKDFNEFLASVQAVCFDDNGYLFPDSEHFRKLEKTKGRTAAQLQVFEELREKIKNRFHGREII